MTTISWDAFWKSGAIFSLDQKSLLIGFGPTKQKASPEELDPESPAFYFPDFFLKTNCPWIQFTSWRICQIEEWEKEINCASSEDIPDWQIGHQELFEKMFGQLKEQIEKKQLEKGVPYTFAYSSSKMTVNRLKQSLKKALSTIKQYPLLLYGYWNEQGGMLGLTPETLFSCNQQTPHVVHTMALAGTKKRGCEGDFLGNKKEEQEHGLVVKGISQSLSSFGIVTLGQAQLLQLPTLTHLLTPIQVSLKEPFHFAKLVEALHPTPALGAFPRQEGWKWLSHYQTQLDRKTYGAPIGYLCPQRGLAACYVAIRQVQWDHQGMRIGAGCGVVKESQCQQEWEEVKLKISAIRSSLAL